MPIITDIISLSHDTIVDLFEIDLTRIGYAGTKFRFCNYSNGNANIVWQGLTYPATAIKAEDFEISGRGQLPTPKITIMNALGAVSSILMTYDDLAGAQVTRRRTLKKYLDGQPGADPTQYLTDQIFLIDRKISESKLEVTFQLRASLDMQGTKLPGRIIAANLCGWDYRAGTGCPYAGGAVADENDVPTTDINQDQCGKRLNSCKLRFGQYGVLPFGAFPGVDSQRF